VAVIGTVDISHLSLTSTYRHINHYMGQNRGWCSGRVSGTELLILGFSFQKYALCLWQRTAGYGARIAYKSVQQARLIFFYESVDASHTI